MSERTTSPDTRRDQLKTTQGFVVKRAELHARHLSMRYFLCLLALAFTACAELETDIEFARPGGVSLTLDAFVPAGEGPFPTCILVHGGGFTKGDKTSFIKPLFEPLSKAGFTWFTIKDGGHGMGGWDKLGSDYKEQMIAWLKKTLAATSVPGVSW